LDRGRQEPKVLDNCVVARRSGKKAGGRIFGSKRWLAESEGNHIRPQSLDELARHSEVRFPVQKVLLVSVASARRRCG